MAIEYRWADNQPDRLPGWRPNWFAGASNVIVANSAHASVAAAKRRPRRSPSCFWLAEDPVRLGLVASLARPGGNVTGVNFFTAELAAKRLELLRGAGARSHAGGRARQSGEPHDCRRPTCGTSKRLLAPWDCKCRFSTPAPVARSTRPSRRLRTSGPTHSSSAAARSSPTARPIGSPRDALRDSRDPWGRAYAEAGGLMSYGASLTDAYRQAGVYTGRILKGARPADLPVVQSTKFELVINSKPPGCSASPCRRRCSRPPTR